VGQFTAFIDESGTHDGSKLTVMAALVGRAEDWEVFEAAWRAILLRDGLEYIHGKDLWQGTAQFKDKGKWPFERRYKLGEELCDLYSEKAAYGLVILLNNSEYDQFYIAGDKKLRKHRHPIDSKYGICCRVCLSMVARIMQKYGSIGEDQVRLVFEGGHKNGGAAETILEEMYSLAPVLSQYLGPDITFAPKKNTPGVQAADLLAYPTFALERDEKASFTDFENGFPFDDSGLGGFKTFRAPVRPVTLEEIKLGQKRLYQIRQVAKLRRSTSWEGEWETRELHSSDGVVLVPPPDQEDQLGRETPYCVLPRCL
jgi:Protein of unknown function (DUF3800)